MARLTPRTDTIRALFARSGNQCAYPGCTHELINSKNKFVAQICHIRAASPGGERHDADMTDEERRGYENLLLLCYAHHVETDDTAAYDVDSLEAMKAAHEALFEKDDFKIDEAALHQIVAEMARYWDEIERLNTLEHSHEELAFRVNVQGTYAEIFESIHASLEGIERLHAGLAEADAELQDQFESMLRRKGIDPGIFEDVPYYENPFQIRNWETHYLGFPNWLQRARIDLAHLELKYLEEYLKTNSRDQKALSRLEVLKASFAEMAQHAIHVD